MLEVIFLGLLLIFCYCMGKRPDDLNALTGIVGSLIGMVLVIAIAILS